MGLIDELTAARVFIDTAPIIYFIETSTKYGPIVKPIFSEIAAGNIQAITSTITLAEVLVHPYQKVHIALAEKYRRLVLHSAGLTTFEILHEVAEKSTQLRAQYNIRTPDAIHLAVGILYSADVFLTNDNTLRQVSEIKVLTLNDYI